MDKIKRIVCVILALCFTVAFTSCGDKTSQDVETTTQNTENNAKEEITVLSLNKEYVSHYEWYEDYPTMLVRSEYSTVVLDESFATEYPALAKTLSETSIMRKKSMEEEKDNLLFDATKEFMNDGEYFLTYISTLDVQVRRADRITVSILEDYYSVYGRSFNGLNYDTESGNLLALSDVITDTSEISEIVENIIMNRIGEEEPFGETAVADYFSNTAQEDINWTLDYNGVTFYFNAGAIAPTNFGVQTATVTFAEYPELFNEKYTVVPDAYIISLPVSSSFYTDVTGNNRLEEIIVMGDCDTESRYYNTLSVYYEGSFHNEEWSAYELDPYYVKTADGNSYIYLFSLNSEDENRETVLSVFKLENGEIKFIGTSEIGMPCKGNKIFALPTDPDNLLLDAYDGATDSVYSADENGVTRKMESEF